MPEIKTLYTQEQIHTRIQEMSQEIARKLPQEFMVIGLLRGSFIFAADLVRALYAEHCKIQMDFMTLSSYGDALESSGQVVIQRDISESVAGRDVVLIDDILESGRTLRTAIDILKDRGAKTVTVAVLLEKPGKLQTKVSADICGFKTPDVFVIGYGLDYKNYYRELPFIGVLCE